jgi:hypothetical protein
VVFVSVPLLEERAGDEEEKRREEGSRGAGEVVLPGQLSVPGWRVANPVGKRERKREEGEKETRGDQGRTASRRTAEQSRADAQ